MNATPALLVVALLALPGLAAADHEDHYVEVENPPPEPPAERDSSYDCAASERPQNVGESIEHNLNEIYDGRQRWGLPYVAPDCLAFDSSLGSEPSAAPSTCSRMSSLGDTAARNRVVKCYSIRPDPPAVLHLSPVELAASPPANVYWSYQMSTGRYTVVLEPGNHTFQGNSGLAVSIDCEECDPPGFSIPPEPPLLLLG